MIMEPLQCRLKVLENEILRLTDLAAEAFDLEQQDSYYRLAQDLQREARELRGEIIRFGESPRPGRAARPSTGHSTSLHPGSTHPDSGRRIPLETCDLDHGHFFQLQ